MFTVRDNVSTNLGDGGSIRVPKQTGKNSSSNQKVYYSPYNKRVLPKHEVHPLLCAPNTKLSKGRCNVVPRNRLHEGRVGNPLVVVVHRNRIHFFDERSVGGCCEEQVFLLC